MGRDYRKWFQEAGIFLNEIIKDQNTVELLLLYEIIENLRTCTRSKTQDQALYREDFKSLTISLWESVSTEIPYRQELTEILEGEISKEDHPFYFLYTYRIPIYHVPKEYGTFWIQYINTLESRGDHMQIEDFARNMIHYHVWNNAYCRCFALQFLNKNRCSVGLNCGVCAPIQYWEYRRVDRFVQKNHRLSLEQLIIAISQFHHRSELQMRYPDRETLFMEMIHKGIHIENAMRMTHGFYKI